MKQITSVCSSQIVVSLGGADYCSNKFPNALFHVICKIYKFLGIFPIVIFYCFSLIFSV